MAKDNVDRRDETSCYVLFRPTLVNCPLILQPPVNSSRLSFLTLRAETGISIPGPGGSLISSRIRCPKCNWSPGSGDRWFCKCGHPWNTFSTGGVCPACGYKWTVTACQRCGEPSSHAEWYVQD
jgi:hypothetical protein